MRPSKTVIYSRFFMQILIIFLGFMILIQGLIREAPLIYHFVGVAIIAYGAYRLYGTLILLLGGNGRDDR